MFQRTLLLPSSFTLKDGNCRFLHNIGYLSTRLNGITSLKTIILTPNATSTSYHLLVHNCGEEYLRGDLCSTNLQEVQVGIYHRVAETAMDICHGLPLDL
jgi:hypothetical protein